jgi:predicted ATPase/DNA-binding winged helix-turn-helix (wHTH) protein
MSTFVFGPFQLLPIERVLLDAGRPLHLGSRATEILFALVERAGEVVEKRELIARVWPSTVVEEATLRVHVAALRKALGEGQAGTQYIQNISGRGYRFVAPVQTIEQGGVEASASAPVADSHHRLPAPLARLTGRTELIQNLVERLPKRRFITLVGPGGIGKTTVALAVANKLAASFADGAQFIELAGVRDASLVASAVASALGVPVLAADPMPGILAALKDKNLLLVLDNCEQIIDAVAHVTEKMLRGAPRLCMIATSREPLRAEGEWINRLRPLEIPTPSKTLTAAAALNFAAIDLFVERASASVETFKLEDEDVPVVIQICRKLDGIPLAIELAAALIDRFGLQGLAALLDDRLQVLTQGRRTAPPRHRTLRAMIDWSFQLLSKRQQTILRRLGVFRGVFDLEAACAVLEDADLGRHHLIEGVADLVDKSLVAVDTTGDAVVYQLLETVRAYIAEQLADSEDRHSIYRRHALWCHDRLTAQVSPKIKPDELRAAIDWCFAAGGDSTLGLKLIAVSGPLWFQHSLLAEYRARAEQALRHLEAGVPCSPEIELPIHAALGEALLHTEGPVPQMVNAFSRALRLAETIHAPGYMRRSLWGLWLGQVVTSEYDTAWAMAQRVRSFSSHSSRSDSLLNERIAAVTMHLTGTQRSARLHAERAIALCADKPDKSTQGAFHYCCDRSLLARVLFVQGFPEQATRVAQDSVDHASRHADEMTHCYTLTCACAVALWCGDLAAVEAYATTLLEHATHHSLVYWLRWGHGIDMVLRLRRGEKIQLAESGRDRQSVHRAEYLCTLLTDELPAATIALADRGRPYWATPEVLRVKAELLLRTKGSSAFGAADALLARSLDIARQQDALSWELRATMSLARLRRDQDRSEEARHLLAAVADRFTEGFETRDFVDARKLLDELTSAKRMRRA